MVSDQSCPRLADYFVVVGPEDGEQRKVDFGDSMSMAIIDRFPSEDWQDTPFIANIPMFCFPSGTSMRSSGEAPSCINFVLDGALNKDEALYGSALIFYEGGGPSGIFSESSSRGGGAMMANANTESKEYFPKAICIISHYPWYDLFSRVLLELYVLAGTPTSLPVERYVYHIMKEIPVPPTGEVAIRFSLGSARFCISRPSKNDLPMTPYGLEAVFQYLSINNIIAMFVYLLLEKRVLMVSRSPSLRTAVGESMLSLLFPFHWQHMYFPVLPMAMNRFVHSWDPFLLGIDSQHLRSLDVPKGVVIVDLDANSIVQTVEVPPLPQTEMKLLESRLAAHVIAYNPKVKKDPREYAKQSPAQAANFSADYGFIFGVPARLFKSSDGSSSPPIHHEYCDFLVESHLGLQPNGINKQFVRSCFLTFFCHILRDYRSYLIPPAQFYKDRFLKRVKHDNKEFMRALIGTECFTKFVSERHSFSGRVNEVYLFDEAIEHEKHRAKHGHHKDEYFLESPRTTLSDFFQVSEINAEDEKLPSGPFFNAKFPKLTATMLSENIKARREMRRSVAGTFGDVTSPPRFHQQAPSGGVMLQSSSLASSLPPPSSSTSMSKSSSREDLVSFAAVGNFHFHNNNSNNANNNNNATIRLWQPPPSRQKVFGTLQGFIEWESRDGRVGPPGESADAAIVPASQQLIIQALQCVAELNDVETLISMLQRLPDHQANDLLLSLLRVFGAAGAPLDLVFKLIEYEVDCFSASSVSLLFRNNSFATRCLSAFLGVSAGKYLNQVLGPTIQAIMKSNKSFEIDPSRDSRLVVPGNLNAAVERLLSVSRTLFASLFDTPVPPVVSKICEFVHNAVDTKFPGFTHSVLTTVIFLRFICPALTTPEGFGLTTSTPSPDAKRAMVLLAKILQLVANGTNVNDKESYLLPLKWFLDEMTTPMAVHIQKLLPSTTVTFRDTMIIESNALMMDLTMIDNFKQGGASTPGSFLQYTNGHQSVNNSSGGSSATGNNNSNNVTAAVSSQELTPRGQTDSDLLHSHEGLTSRSIDEEYEEEEEEEDTSGGNMSLLGSRREFPQPNGTINSSSSSNNNNSISNSNNNNSSMNGGSGVMDANSVKRRLLDDEDKGDWVEINL